MILPSNHSNLQYRIKKKRRRCIYRSVLGFYAIVENRRQPVMGILCIKYLRFFGFGCLYDTLRIKEIELFIALLTVDGQIPSLDRQRIMLFQLIGKKVNVIYVNSLSLSLSLSLSFSLSLFLSVCLSVCLSVSLSACL